MSRRVSKTIDLSTLGGASEVGKYITRIDDDGIKVHPIDWGDSLSNSYLNYTKIDSNGMSVYKHDTKVADFGETATIGNINGQHISITNNQIEFWGGSEQIGDNRVAYVSDQELHIPRVVVVQSLKMSNWIWDGTLKDHLSLNWVDLEENVVG